MTLHKSEKSECRVAFITHIKHVSPICRFYRLLVLFLCPELSSAVLRQSEIRARPSLEEE